MKTARTATLVAATLGSGIMSGVFFIYSNAIMPGLGDTNDRTFVGAFQQIDTAIINPVFLIVFMGTLVITGIALFLHRAKDQRSLLPWIAGAFVLYLAVVIATVTINVPLNDEIKAAGDPDQIADLAAVREQFNEARWVASNHFRTVATTLAFGCLTWSLVLVGRVEQPTRR